MSSFYLEGGRKLVKKIRYVSGRESGSDQATSLIFKKIWPNGKYFGALNPLSHGRNQACKKYLALAIHKIRSPQWPMSHAVKFP
jgi:hypothetical protein